MSSGNACLRRDVRRLGMASVILAIAAVSPTVPRSVLAEAPTPAPRTIVDPALVPAGGCRGCNASACRTCQGRRGGHHPVCRDGKCHPHCPVRPQEFGFYGTQWRRWPDRQIVPVSHERDGAPALPPRSQLPRSDEEARRATEDEAAAPSERPDEDAVDGLNSGVDDEPARRRPLEPRGEEDPALPPDSSGALQPRLLPQAMRGDDGSEPDRPLPLTEQHRTAAARRIDATPRPDGPRPVSQAIAPEPAPSAVVVTTAAEADAAIDESSLGPARRRFVARRPSLEGAGGREPVPAAVP